MGSEHSAAYNCSVARSLEVVGEWWTLLLIRDMWMYDVHRFDAFHERLGIARNVLTKRLSSLVEAGVVDARPYSERPRRYEYHLTQKGKELSMVLYALLRWGDQHTREGTPPPVRIEHALCGHVLEPVMGCIHCGKMVDATDTRIQFASESGGKRVSGTP
jgi:DNA-binding HxlR family transcriptional regulator